MPVSRIRIPDNLMFPYLDPNISYADPKHCLWKRGRTYKNIKKKNFNLDLFYSESGFGGKHSHDLYGPDPKCSLVVSAPYC